MATFKPKSKVAEEIILCDVFTLGLSIPKLWHSEYFLWMFQTVVFAIEASTAKSEDLLQAGTYLTSLLLLIQRLFIPLGLIRNL